MRILTVTSSFPRFEGDTTAPFIESITRELAARGHELTVVLPARDDLDPAPIEGVRFEPFRYAPARSLQVFGYAEALRADVAVRGKTYGVLPFAVLAGVRALRRELRSRRYDVVHAHWIVPSGAMASLALGGNGVPLVVSLHGSDVFLAEKSGLARKGAGAAFRKASALTACSAELAARSRSLGARTAPEVIPYGVDLEAFRPDLPGGAALRERLAIPPQASVVFTAGRLVHKKGFEYLVDAAARLAGRGERLALVIAGRGDLAPELEHRARELGIAMNLRLVGNVERAELPLYFAMADVVAVPSVRDPAGNVDGLPNVLLEAMASGKPIVATSIAGIPEALATGEEGILVPERDPTALADAIGDLIRSKERRERLARGARVRAQRDFLWRRTGEKFDLVLRSVAEARRS